MPTYNSWAELSAAETLGTDYRIPIRKHRSTAISIAIHGGAIEPGSSAIASGVAARCRHNYYSFDAIDGTIFLSSVNYDEPQLLAMLNGSDFCFSFHGMNDVTAGVAQTYVSGLDSTNRDAIISALQGFGFPASIGDPESDGNLPGNVANKTRLGKGVSIYISLTQRQNFFTGGDLSAANRQAGNFTQAYFDYVKAISSVTNFLGGGALQTSQYNLSLATADDYMSDFETWLNANWTRLRDAPAPPSGATLPQSGPYRVGDRFYLTTTRSIYLLVARDANWGWYWRPVQDPISPWFTVPATCMAISGWSLNSVSGKPFQIALDSRGECYWRGVIGPTSGNFTRNVTYNIFKALPDGIRPRQRQNFICGHETLAIGTDSSNLASYQGVRLFISEGPTIQPSVRSFGGNADFNRVYLDGAVQYAVGAAEYYKP